MAVKGKWDNSKKAEQLRMQNPFGDFDKDGVPNLLDCQPFNSAEHGWIGDTWKSIQQRVVAPTYRKAVSYVKPYVAPVITAVTQVVKRYIPKVSYERAAERREAVIRELKRKKKTKPIKRVSIKPVPGQMGLLMGAEAITPILRKKIIPSIKRIPGKVITPITKIPEKLKRVGVYSTTFGYIKPTEKVTPTKIEREVPKFKDILFEPTKTYLRTAETVAKKGEIWSEKHIVTPVRLEIGGEKQKERAEQQKKIEESYSKADKLIKEKWIQPSKEIILPTIKSQELINWENKLKAAITQEDYDKIWYAEVDKYYIKGERANEYYTKDEYIKYTPAAQEYVTAIETAEAEQAKLGGMPKPHKAKQLAMGAGAMTAALPGFFVATIPRVTAGTILAPTAAPGKLVEFGVGMKKYAKEEPYEFTGGMLAMLLGPKALKVAKAKTYAIPTRLRGVHPHVGEPSIFGKIMGKKYHPTVEARPLSETQLKAGIFKAEAPYFHGTSLSFVKQIKKGGGITISPEAPITAVESGLFFGAPKRPYISFVAPTKTIRVKMGDITNVPGLKSYVIKGSKPSAKVEIPYDIYAEAIVKSTKPSTRLTALIENQKAIQKQVGKELLPRTKAELRGRQEYLQEQIYQQAMRESGIKTTAFEAPGAFLEFKTIPKKPSPKLTSMSLELEKLIVKLEKGTKAERAKAAKYRDVLEKTRWEWRFKRVAPKYGLAREAVAVKKKSVMSAKEIKRMDYLKAEIKKLGLKEFEVAAKEAKLADPAKAIAGKYWKGIGEAEHVAPPGMELYPLESARGKLYSMFGIEKGKYRIYDPMSQRWTEVLGVSEKAPRGYKLPKEFYEAELIRLKIREAELLKHIKPSEAARYIAGHKIVEILSKHEIPIEAFKTHGIKFSEIKGIPKQSAPAIEKFLRNYQGEYRIFGSTIERTLFGEKMKVPGDVDLAIGNPRTVAYEMANIIRKTSGTKTKVVEYPYPKRTLGGARYGVDIFKKGEWVDAFTIDSLRGHLGEVIGGKYPAKRTIPIGNILMEQLIEQLERRAASVFELGKTTKIGPVALGKAGRIKDIPRFETMVKEILNKGKFSVGEKSKINDLLNTAMGRKKAKFDVTKELTVMSKKYIKPKPDVIVPTKKVRIIEAKPILDLGDIYKKITEVKPKKLSAKQFKEIGRLKSEIERAYKESDISTARRLEARINQIRYAPGEHIPLTIAPLLGDREIFPDRRVGRITTTPPERLLGIVPERKDRRGTERTIERIIGRERRPERREERREERKPERREETREERREGRQERREEREREERRPQEERRPERRLREERRAERVITTLLIPRVVTIPKPKKKPKKKKIPIKHVELGAFKYGEITPVAMPKEALGLLGVGTVEKGKYVYNPKDAVGFITGE